MNKTYFQTLIAIGTVRDENVNSMLIHFELNYMNGLAFILYNHIYC